MLNTPQFQKKKSWG